MIRNNLLRSFRNSQEILWIYITFYSQEILRILYSFVYQKIHKNFFELHLSNLSQSIYLYLQFLIMTCDFESVESWTTCLLKSIANKWVFLLSFDVSAESQNDAISWNIKIKEQLCQWVIDYLNEIIKMLNELKDQQDMTLKCNKHWIVLQIKYIKRLKQLEINRASMNTLEEINTWLREKMLSLKDRLKEVQRSTNQSRSWQSTESRSTTNHLSQQDIESHASIENHTRREMSIKFISFENEHHQFYKFLNSFIFTDEDELTWKDWRNKMNDKLIVNVDQFNDETICIVYMMSRLEDDVAKHIFARRCFDSSNSFTLIYELFDHLKEIYDELNKNWKSRREYNVLRQADKSFNVFYFNFMKLFSDLDYDDCILMNDLQNKINNRLQNALSICSEKFTSLSRLKKFLQDVNNKQRVNYQLRSERRTVIVKVTVVPDKRVIFEFAKSSIICYICKISSHLFKNCSQNKINILTSQAFFLRLHEIIISKNKENEKMSFKNSEAKN